MKKLLALAIVAGSVALFACNNGTKTEESSTKTDSTTTTAAPAPAPAPADSTMKTDTTKKMDNGGDMKKEEKKEETKMEKK